jgi:8-oxo-dGTP pyrophosphatase MutT (NUDIX family)
LTQALAAVRPRHAATLVAWRRGRREIEVLMGRRAARHSFVPDHYVFPGGRLDSADYRAKAKTRLRPEVAKQLCAHCTPARAHALAVAAARETFEETGLALGELDAGVLLPTLDRLDYLLRAITPVSSPIRFHARFFAVEARHLAGTLRGSGELLDLDWRPLEECLRLPIVDVTGFLLRKLAAGPDFMLRGKRVPLVWFRNDRFLVR